MQIIKFKESQKEEWNKFIADNCSESFLQSWEWGDFQEKTGKKIWRLGIMENGKLLSIFLIIKNDFYFGRSYFYSPRGPVFDKSKVKSQKSKILELLFLELKKIAKKEKALFLKFDFPIKLNDSFLKEQILMIKKSVDEVQPQNTLILNLEKSEDELLKEMKSKTRYNIRLAKKKGIQITNYKLGDDNKEIFKEKFNDFWNLIKETSGRNKIISHRKDYYWKMFDNLNYSEQFSNKEILQTELYLADYQGRVIAANIVFSFGDLVIYLHGASSNKDRNLMAPYLLQWQQIVNAKKRGYKKYDFWGITINGEKESWQGITKFKKGFRGEEKSYIGAYDLIFNNIGYIIYRIIKQIKLLKSKIFK